MSLFQNKSTQKKGLCSVATQTSADVSMFSIDPTFCPTTKSTDSNLLTKSLYGPTSFFPDGHGLPGTRSYFTLQDLQAHQDRPSLQDLQETYNLEQDPGMRLGRRPSIHHSLININEECEEVIRALWTHADGRERQEGHGQGDLGEDILTSGPFSI